MNKGRLKKKPNNLIFPVVKNYKAKTRLSQTIDIIFLKYNHIVTDKSKTPIKGAL